MKEPVGRVLGTQDAMPLEFWVAVGEGQYLQLDDVVELESPLPDGSQVRLYGVVDLVRARHEGTQLDSDVFLVEKGVLPAAVAEAAHVRVTRVEPEIFVPPRPGQPVRRAEGLRRDEALFFDGMERKVPIGLSRDGEPVFANLDFLDGTRGAHVNISGISGVATKTSYATFLLHSLFTCGALGGDAANTHALVFNVKGEDLLFLDQPNAKLKAEDRAAYAKLGLPAERFSSVQILAPVRKSSPERLPATGSRSDGVVAFFWTVREVVEERLLRFLFAEAEDASSQLSFVVDRIEAKLASAAAARGQRSDPWIDIEGQKIESFDALVEALTDHPDGDDSLADRWARPAAAGTVAAFERRLHAAAKHVGHLIRGKDVGRREQHLLDWKRTQLSVVDIHALHDRAKRFVVGAVLKRMFEDKESLGTARPLVFVVLDELNKYAPREGSGPIKEVLLDISERGRSLGIVLIGAQQTASEVEGRIVANASLRVVGRLDTAEAERPEYGFLTAAGRGRAGHPETRHHDRAAAGDPDAAAVALPVPGVGDASQRGAGDRSLGSRSRASADALPAHGRLARRQGPARPLAAGGARSRPRAGGAGGDRGQGRRGAGRRRRLRLADAAARGREARLRLPGPHAGRAHRLRRDRRQPRPPEEAGGAGGAARGPAHPHPARGAAARSGWCREPRLARRLRAGACRGAAVRARAQGGRRLPGDGARGRLVRRVRAAHRADPGGPREAADAPPPSTSCWGTCWWTAPGGGPASASCTWARSTG